MAQATSRKYGEQHDIMESQWEAFIDGCSQNGINPKPHQKYLI